MNNKFENKRFMKVFGIYFAILMAFVVVRLVNAYGFFAKLGDELTVDLVSTAIIQIGIMFLVPLFLYMAFFGRSVKQTFSDFKFKKIGIKAIIICFLLGILGFVVNLYASTFFSIILTRLGYRYSGGGSSGYDTLPKFLLGILTVAILPAICEEFAHRGLLLQGTRKLWGYKMAIVISSVFFGLMHLNIQQFFFATVLGILMAYVDICAGSILPSIIMHFMNNFINVFLSYAQSTGLIKFSISGFLNAIYSKSVVLFVLFVSFVLFLCLMAILGLIKLLHKVSLQNKKQEILMQGFNAQESDQTKNFQTQSVANLQAEVPMLIENIVEQPAPKHANEEQKKPKAVGEWAEAYIAPNDSKKINVSFLEKVPFILCFVLAIMVTAFTFIWGVI